MLGDPSTLHVPPRQMNPAATVTEATLLFQKLKPVDKSYKAPEARDIPKGLRGKVC